MKKTPLNATGLKQWLSMFGEPRKLARAADISTVAARSLINGSSPKLETLEKLGVTFNVPRKEASSV
jgi:hypothetical protein